VNSTSTVLWEPGRATAPATRQEIVYEVPREASSARRVQIILAGGNTVTVKDERVTITMGATKVDIAADGDVTLKAAGNLVLEAGGDVTIKAGKNADVEAGANATLKAGANATVQGSAAAALKGATTSIAGVTSFSPS